MPSLSRAAVIVPSICDFYFTQHRFSSLGARIVERLLTRQGITTTLFDFPRMRRHGTPLSLPPELSYLRPFLIEHEIGGLSFFTKFQRFGPDTTTCARMIAESRPELCLFSVFAFAYADSALELAAQVKRLLPCVPVVMGGGGPSAFPEYFLTPAVDFVITGEAEVSITPFVAEVQRTQPAFDQVPNLTWRHNGIIQHSSVTHTASGNEFELMFSKTAETTRVVTWSTMLSRGCPMHCTFCSGHLALGKSFRTPSLERVIDALSSIEIPEQSSKKQLVINLEDDNILADEQYAQKTITAIRSLFPQGAIVMENGIDYRFLTPENTNWLINNGMRKFNISLGSLHPDILNARHRTCSLEQYEGLLDYLEQYSIPRVTYFICGFPEDTTDSVAYSLRYLSSQNTTIGISPFYAVPGIAGYTATSLFLRNHSSRCLGAACYPWNGSLSTETIITAFRLARYVNLCKKNHRSDIENKLIDKVKDTKSLHTMIKEPGTRSPGIAIVERQDSELVKKFFDETE